MVRGFPSDIICGQPLMDCLITAISGFDYFLHAIASALNNYGFSMVKKAIKQCRSEGGVVVEDFGPILELLDWW